MTQAQKTTQKQIVFLSGLPRSGSTVLTHALAQHPKIQSTPSSPLCSIIQGARKQWSDEPFLLAQLDNNMDDTYSRLQKATIAFINEYSSGPKPVTIDKSRGWLFAIELLNYLFPDFKMIITIRDLRGILASIEKRHKQTLLLEFPDHMEPNLIDARANQLFSPQGVIGGPLKAIENLDDIVPPLYQHICWCRYEDFLENPKETISFIYKWLELEPYEINLVNMQADINEESDSWYRMKYSHKIHNKFSTDNLHTDFNLSPRITKATIENYLWYYQKFYPMIFQDFLQQNQPNTNNTQHQQNTNTQQIPSSLRQTTVTEDEISRQISEAITMNSEE